MVQVGEVYKHVNSGTKYSIESVKDNRVLIRSKQTKSEIIVGEDYLESYIETEQGCVISKRFIKVK